MLSVFSSAASWAKAGRGIWSSVVAVQIGGAESFTVWLADPVLHKQAVNRYKYLSAGEHLAQGDLAPRIFPKHLRMHLSINTTAS